MRSRLPHTPDPTDCAGESSRCAVHAHVVRVFVVVALLYAFPLTGPAQTGRERALAALTAAGLAWDESERAITVTDGGRSKLTSLGSIQGALRELQPWSFDLTSCSLLQDVDAIRGLRSLRSINLSDCPALKSVDGIAGTDRLKKIYLFESMNITAKSLAALERRFPKSYIVLPDGTGLKPPRDQE